MYPTLKFYDCKLCNGLVLINSKSENRPIRNKKCIICNNYFCFDEKTFSTTFSKYERFECYDIHKSLCEIQKKIENLNQKVLIGFKQRKKEINKQRKRIINKERKKQKKIKLIQK